MIIPDVTSGEAPSQGGGQECLGPSQLHQYHSLSKAFETFAQTPPCSSGPATSPRKPALSSQAEAPLFSP